MQQWNKLLKWLTPTVAIQPATGAGLDEEVATEDHLEDVVDLEEGTIFEIHMVSEFTSSLC